MSVTSPIDRRRLFDRRSVVLFLLGFFAGLPAALTAGTLQAWFTAEDLNLRLIGGVTLLVLPYSLRFLWTPLFDEVRLPVLGRRRGWLLLLQCGLVASTLVMAFVTPAQRFGIVPWLVLPAFAVSVFAASQEMVINAWQTEMFEITEHGYSAGLYAAGWRVGAVISGGVALALAAHVGWHRMYLLMAGLMAFAPVVTLFAPRVQFEKCAPRRRIGPVLYSAICEFFKRSGVRSAMILMAIILTYKLGDALAVSLNTTFLLREKGFSLETVGLVNKIVSLSAALIGSLVGGLWMRRLPLFRALTLFAVIQALSHIGYVLLATRDSHVSLLVFAALAENFCSGMGTVALLALIFDISRVEYRVTQLALFNALAYVPRVLVGPTAAWMVVTMGWFYFFVICMALSLLPVVFIRMARRRQAYF